jgi:hypothetical protein
MTHSLDDLDYLGEIWWHSMSSDPASPSCFTVKTVSDIGLFDTAVTVMPGEVLRAYRNTTGMVVVGFRDVTVH